MEIRILHQLGGASQARGTTVVIDVFRAFTTACELFAAGVERILAVADIQRAHDLKREDPARLLLGERDCIPLPGFDFGNSPALLQGHDLQGRTIVQTTSAGTRGLVAAANAAKGPVFTGAFVNAAATARAVIELQPEVVSLVALGDSGQRPSEEDESLARFLRSLLKGVEPPADIVASVRNELRGIESARKFFDPEQTWAPAEDFKICTAVDRHDFAIEGRLLDAELVVLERQKRYEQ